MKAVSFKILVAGAAVLLGTAGVAETMDRPRGIRIGQRLTLRPYVSLSATYDSNVYSYQKSGPGRNTDDVMWTVNPGLAIDYRADTWALLLSAYYNYRAYTKKTYWNSCNQHSYGETLRWNWSNSKGAEKGWSLMLSESFSQITMADDISLDQYRNYNSDRRQLSVQGAAQRRFNEHWHSELAASYYYLDYLNDTKLSNALYGWQRWAANWSAGFAPSRWTDLLVNLGYQGYEQDNVEGTRLSRESQGCTAQFGLGSYATERISYRALLGWSRFEYADASDALDGFVYTLSGNWKISDTLNTMFLASSYYQPSEREVGACSRVDALSWGLGKSLVRGKLRTTLDITYRRESHEYINSSAFDYTLDTLSARLGLDYTLNRFMALFTYAEFIRGWTDAGGARSTFNDYDRWRVTGGVRFTY